MLDLKLYADLVTTRLAVTFVHGSLWSQRTPDTQSTTKPKDHLGHRYTPVIAAGRSMASQSRNDERIPRIKEAANRTETLISRYFSHIPFPLRCRSAGLILAVIRLGCRDTSVGSVIVEVMNLLSSDEFALVIDGSSGLG